MVYKSGIGGLDVKSDVTDIVIENKRILKQEVMRS